MTPGEALAAHDELRAADEALQAGRALVELGFLRDAASRLYYAAFHAARAALTSRGVVTKTHSGQQSRFADIFGADPTLGRLLGTRSRADYGHGAFGETGDSLRGLAADAAAFVEKCRGLVAAAQAAGPDEPDPPPDL